MMGNFTPSICWKRTEAGFCQEIPDFYADTFHCQRRVEDAWGSSQSSENSRDFIGGNVMLEFLILRKSKTEYNQMHVLNFKIADFKKLWNKYNQSKKRGQSSERKKIYTVY